MRVLVVEDHPKLALTVATGLRHAGMAVDVAFDGRDALDQVAEADYDVVVLDRDLPGVSGDEVCRRLVRHGSTIRVLMLTAAGDLALDPARRTATRAGRDLGLNPKEFAVLEILLAAHGTVVSSEQLLTRAWDQNADPFSQAVKTTMSRLRAKLGDPPVIETVAK